MIPKLRKQTKKVSQGGSPIGQQHKNPRSGLACAWRHSGSTAQANKEPEGQGT